MPTSFEKYYPTTLGMTVVQIESKTGDFFSNLQETPKQCSESCKKLFLGAIFTGEHEKKKLKYFLIFFSSRKFYFKKNISQNFEISFKDFENFHWKIFQKSKKILKNHRFFRKYFC